MGVEPCTNYNFTKTLGSVLNRPTLCWIPLFVLKLGYYVMGDMVNETILASIKARPTKLLENGFVFNDVNLEATLSNMLKINLGI